MWRENGTEKKSRKNNRKNLSCDRRKLSQKIEKGIFGGKITKKG